MFPCRKWASYLSLCTLLWTCVSQVASQVLGNTPPQPGNFQTTLIWDEDTPIGTIIGNLTAIDSDGPAPLTFDTDTQSTADLVRLSATRKVDSVTKAVDIILKAQLDRDYAPNERKLYFKISDGSSEIPAKISLFIRDVNDVKPQFINLPYKATIPENVEKGQVVFKGVRATDPDNGRGGTVSYNMTTEAQGADEEYRTTFAINEYDGTITLTRKLDYEKHSFYQFKINAMDGGGLQAEAADFIVTVLDIQDTAPKFSNLPYSTGIAEDITVGSSVIQVVGFDQDLGIPNGLSYRFVRGDYQNFQVDSNTGWITVKNNLDRDFANMSASGGVYAMYVQASEIVPLGQQNFGNTTAEEIVTITVLDVNDNAPTFSQSSYTAQIQENMQNGVPVTFLNSFMRVFDGDQGTNSHFSLSLKQNGQPYYDFTTLPQEVYTESTVLIRVNNSQELDYEKQQQIVFQVVAREIDTKEKKSSTATVTVNILDMNDNAPNFTHPLYIFPNVAEDTPKDTSIGAIFASDGDSGSYGRVSYSIRGGNGKFRVDSLTGDLYVNGPLDRETTSEYFLSAEAIDGGGLRAPSEIQIIVTDVNDRPPIFRRSDYEGVAREKASAFLRPIVVEAFDDDEPNTPNSQVRYRIDSTPSGLERNFTIDAATGAISLVTPLDYEKLNRSLNGKVVLQVAAYDAGPGQLSSTVFVNITVEDINDFPPVFFPATYTVNITENSPAGTSVVKVTATDGDGTSPNNDFFYRIESGALDKFSMSFETGQIFVEGGTLDREEKQEYVLRVSATDRGNSPLSGFCNVTIRLLNINDEMPVFARKSDIVSISENLGVGQTVYTYSATDADDDSSLKYSLLTDETRALDENGESVNVTALGINNYFAISQNNGTIRVASQLDRETVERIVIKIMVQDVNAAQPPQQSATATLTVSLTDYNDNPPEFIPSSQFHVNVSEAEGINSVILRVDTRDRDRGQKVTYQLTRSDDDPEGSSFFAVDATTGIVLLAKRLDRETKASHTFIIIAKDDGIPQQTSSATVSIVVMDVNDNIPAFIAFNANVEVAENVSTGYQVIQMSATDKDAGDFGRIVYSLEGADNEGNFQIDPNTGKLTVVKQLDRETKSVYRLEVVARDSAPDVVDQKSKRESLTIRVTDVNDNEPQFEAIASPPKVSESLQPPDSVFTVRASDADEGVNGQVQYTLTGETNATTASGTRLFSIGLNTGIVTVSQPLHSLAGFYFITVQASDRGSPPKAKTQKFMIEVYDVNDAYPVFSQPNPDNPLFVQEDQPPGTLVVKLVAEDSDTGQNGLVSYSLVPNQDSTVLQNFQVNSTSGELTTKAALDREAKSEYLIEVRATDHGYPQNHSTDMTLRIKVRDVNDQPPMFDRGKIASPFIVNFRENETSKCVNVSVAEDSDSDPANAIICYYLVGVELTDVFTLETSGRLCLRSNKVLDREQTATTNVVIKALEKCYENISPQAMAPSGSSSPAVYDANDKSLLWVQVKVTDINDNPPVFVRKDLAIGITRDIQLGKIILNLKDEVVDADSDEWGVGRFEALTDFQPHPTQLADALTNMGVTKPFQLFSNGSVKVDTYFNADMSGYFIVTVRTVDKGGLADTAQLRISLISDSQRLKVVFRESLGVVADYRNEFARRMSAVTGYRIVVDKIQTHENANNVAEADKTDMFIHGEDTKTNEIVPAVDLLGHIDQLSANAQMVSVLNDYNILEIVETTARTSDNEMEKKLQMALILVSVILGVICIILAVVLYFTYKRYSRKLKAATAMAYGPQETDLYKVDIPGTNMHSYEKPTSMFEGATRF